MNLRANRWCESECSRQRMRQKPGILCMKLVYRWVQACEILNEAKFTHRKINNIRNNDKRKTFNPKFKFIADSN